MKYLMIYLLLVNAAGLLLMLIDKWKAIHDRCRIPEKTLFLTAVLGGSIGTMIGIYLFRHKTRHRSFTIGIPVILLLQCAAAFGLWYLFA